MKTHHLLISVLSFFVLFSSCKSSPLDKRATGLAYEIVVTMDTDIWNSEAGEAIKAELLSAVPALPQAEPTMRITYAQPRDFKGLLTYVRNILMVNIDPTQYTKVSLTYDKDTWANGQVVVILKSPDKESIIEFMAENKRILADYYTKVEMGRATQLLEKSYSPVVLKSVNDEFGISLKAPEKMLYTKNAEDFLWASDNAKTGRTDLVVYTFPYTDPDTFTSEYLVAKRDSVMKINMPGSFPDSYMTTETRYATVDYTPISVNGKYCGVLRGLWRMEGDMMGGPFVAHVRLDEANKRVVVAEGFVYAPETDKRNYIRRVEAALYTLRLPGEFEEMASEEQSE